MSKPYRKGNVWYIKLENGYEMEFVSFEEAWEYYSECHTDE